MVHPATLPKDASKSYDFIVLGGGPGGCTVAGRLAENPNVSVLLVEAGVRYVPFTILLMESSDSRTL